MKLINFLQPVETMKRVSRVELAEKLDDLLEVVNKENVGFVITDEGKDDLVLCPAKWFDLYYDDDFGCIINSAVPTEVVSVQLKAGEGILKRGTIVTGTPGGQLAPASAALKSTDGTYILTDDVDVSAGAVATAYRSGHFARNKVITGGNYTITAADEEILRNAGILFADAIEI